MIQPRFNIPRLRRQAVDDGGLFAFMRLAWPSVETGEFAGNWHHELICDALERVTRGECRKLVISVPPGTTKTHLTGVSWPAWQWIHRPEKRMIHTTYGGNLALKAARQSRDLVNSEFYRDVTDGKVCIPYQNTHAAAWFENNHKGSRFSGSVGGEVTGRHAHDLVGDDLNKAIDALGASVTKFDAAWDFWNEILPTRQADPKETNRILIGQRLHRDDVPGRWMREDPDVEVICLPMRYEPDHPHAHPLDPRRDPEFYEKKGGLLWPERFPEEAVKELERSPTMAAAQLQQRPIPPGGYLLCEEYLAQRYELLPSRLKRTLETKTSDREQIWGIYCDATFKGKVTSDYVVVQVWCKYRGEYYLIDQIRGQWGFRETKRQIRDLQAKYPWVLTTKIEDAANAAAIVDDMHGTIPGLGLAAMGGGCLARTQQVEGVWASGAVKLPASSPWMGGSDGFVAEHLSFDGLGTRHDDQVSCSSLALLDLSVSRGARYADKMRRIREAR